MYLEIPARICDAHAPRPAGRPPGPYTRIAARAAGGAQCLGLRALPILGLQEGEDIYTIGGRPVMRLRSAGRAL